MELRRVFSVCNFSFVCFPFFSFFFPSQELPIQRPDLKDTYPSSFGQSSLSLVFFVSYKVEIFKAWTLTLFVPNIVLLQTLYVGYIFFLSGEKIMQNILMGKINILIQIDVFYFRIHVVTKKCLLTATFF